MLHIHVERQENGLVPTPTSHDISARTESKQKVLLSSSCYEFDRDIKRTKLIVAIMCVETQTDREEIPLKV